MEAIVLYLNVSFSDKDVQYPFYSLSISVKVLQVDDSVTGHRTLLR